MIWGESDRFALFHGGRTINHAMRGNQAIRLQVAFPICRCVPSLQGGAINSACSPSHFTSPRKPPAAQYAIVSSRWSLMKPLDLMQGLFDLFSERPFAQFQLPDRNHLAFNRIPEVRIRTGIVIRPEADRLSLFHDRLHFKPCALGDQVTLGAHNLIHSRDLGSSANTQPPRQLGFCLVAERQHQRFSPRHPKLRKVDVLG